MVTPRKKLSTSSMVTPAWAQPGDLVPRHTEVNPAGNYLAIPALADTGLRCRSLFS